MNQKKKDREDSLSRALRSNLKKRKRVIGTYKQKLSFLQRERDAD